MPQRVGNIGLGGIYLLVPRQRGDYEKRKALGLCPSCGIRPSLGPPSSQRRPGYISRGVYCSVCLEVARKANKKYKEEGRGKETSKWSAFRRRYGLDRNSYYKLLESQGGLCALCNLPGHVEGLESGRLVVDHHHATDVVRALVHNYPCNFLIGHVDNFPHLIGPAQEYVKKYSAPAAST